MCTNCTRKLKVWIIGDEGNRQLGAERWEEQSMLSSACGRGRGRGGVLGFSYLLPSPSFAHRPSTPLHADSSLYPTKFTLPPTNMPDHSNKTEVAILSLKHSLRMKIQSSCSPQQLSKTSGNGPPWRPLQASHNR
jgi:hypothetical protein